MTNPRPVHTADGRLGFPEIACYELMAGPDKGKRLAVPPTLATHRMNPTSAISWPYRLVVLDQAEYRRLEEAGFWLSPEHRGGAERIVDKMPPGG